MSNDSGLYVTIQHVSLENLSLPNISIEHKCIFVSSLKNDIFLQGLEFLDTLVHVTQAHENQLQDIFQAWLSLLLKLILTERNAVPYLMEFFQSQCVVVKDYHTFLKQEVNN